MINVITTIGHIGGEIKTFGAENQFCSFSLAHSYKERNSKTQELVETTIWYKIVVFGKGLVAVAKDFCSVGDKLCITGELKQESYTDREGNERTPLKIIARGIAICNRKGDSSNLQNTGETLVNADTSNKTLTKKSKATTQTHPMIDDSIPF